MKQYNSLPFMKHISKHLYQFYLKIPGFHYFHKNRSPSQLIENSQQTKIHSSPITVALVCYQEKEKLRYILEDLKQQSAFKQIGEVLLIQNDDCERTKKTAQGFLSQLPLVILSNPVNNLGLARAKVVKKAKYDWIAWTDSDCRLPKKWLESLVFQWDKINQKHLAAIGGPNRLPEKQLWQKAVNLSLNFAIGHGWSPQTWIPKQARKSSHIPTTNGLFLKKAILQAGNFSSNYPLIGEDLDLGSRLKRQGHLLLCPSPIVINSYADTYFDSLKRLFFFGSAQSQQKSRLFYLSLPFAPLMLCCIILGFFWSLFFLIPLSYFVFLFFYSCFSALKSKKKTAFLLPFFWFGQHTCYSLGAVSGLLARIYKRKNYF